MGVIREGGRLVINPEVELQQQTANSCGFTCILSLSLQSFKWVDLKELPAVSQTKVCTAFYLEEEFVLSHNRDSPVEGFG